jgi:hypothetical protein
MIEVRCTSPDDPRAFEVMVGDGAGATRHEVTMSEEAQAALDPGGHAPERVIEAAFAFLLDREPKDSILPRFDITVISQYFSDFEQELPGYLAKR